MPYRLMKLGAILLIASASACPALAQHRSGAPAATTSKKSSPPAEQHAAPPAAPAVAQSYDASVDARASKLIGSTIYNDQDQPVGTLDDILISRGNKQPVRAVISVGGFLGVGNKLVELDYALLKFEANNRVVLPNATKDELNSMQSFTYRAGDTGGSAIGSSLNGAPLTPSAASPTAGKPAAHGKS